VLEVPNWPLTASGLRVALLPDLHVGSPYVGLAKLREIVGLVNGARPDLVLVLGDLVIQGVRGGRFVPPERTAGELGRIQAPLGVYAVLGNHDAWLDASRVRRALEGAGIPVLEDSAVRIAPGPSLTFWLAGVSDFWTGTHDVRAALRGVPEWGSVLAFTHNPDIFPQVPARVSLTLAGHTHGGQVRLPLFGPPIVPSRFGQRYAAGHVVEGGRHLFVATGVGTSIIPVRFGVPPEVVVVTVRCGGWVPAGAGRAR
jgi:predicted MPP superfamily phosphohydrolase